MNSAISSRVPRLLRDTPFRRYWTGQSLSRLGDQISMMALPLTAVIILHANAQAMGILSALGLIPSLLFSIHAGAWVDKFGRRRQIMMVADIARAFLLIMIPVAYFLGRLNLVELFCIMFFTGTFGVLFRVSSSTLFVSLVSKERYIEANSLLQGSRAMAWLAGPSIGGFVVQLFSAPLALLADACSFVVSAVCLARIHPAEPPAAEIEPGHTSAGLRFIWATPVLRVSQAAMATINVFHAVFMALYVLYATQWLNISPLELGIILGPGSVGAVFGTAVAGRISKKVGLGCTFMIGTILFTGPLVLVPLARGNHLTVVVILFVAECMSGMGLMVLDISNGSIQAAAIPNHLRARVMGAYGFVNKGLRAFGALLGGVLPSVIGIHYTLLAAVIGASLGFLWLLPSSIIRLRDVEDFIPQEPGRVGGYSS